MAKFILEIDLPDAPGEVEALMVGDVLEDLADRLHHYASLRERQLKNRDGVYVGRAFIQRKEDQ